MAPGVPRRVTWRRLREWPYEPQKVRPSLFRSAQSTTMDLLEAEVGRAKGVGLTIGVVLGDANVMLDGSLRMPIKPMHPGCEVSFEHVERGRLVFHTAAFAGFYDNMHAIAKGLEALRAIERYGIGDTGEQYAGWAALPPGGVTFAPDPEEGQRIAAEHGGLKAAMKALHPDRNEGQTTPEYQHVMAFKEAIGA